MHGMGCTDNCGPSEYWGGSYMSKLAPNAKHFYVNTNSKYCDFKPGSCAGTVKATVDDGSGGKKINTGLDKAQRGPLVEQYKKFIDDNQCNVIIAHSMGNPVMAKVVETYGNDYKWYDSAGPMRGSTAASVVYEYCNVDIAWTDFLGVRGVEKLLMKALTSGMGYCGTGGDQHNALISMMPHGTNTWAAAHGSCVNDAFSWGSAATCSARTGGSHLQTTSVKKKWFEYSSTQKKRVQSQYLVEKKRKQGMPLPSVFYLFQIIKQED